MTAPRFLREMVHPHYVSGSVIEAPLRNVTVGEICHVRRHWRNQEVVARAQVVGFRCDMAVLILLGTALGLSRESLIEPTGSAFQVRVCDDLLGAVLDASCRCIERMAPIPVSGNPSEMRAIDADPPSFHQRVPISEMFLSGVRVIDAMLTCGIGQRVGIFSSAGSGKTSLVKMLVDMASADVVVIGLIGERGREVTEFVDALKKSARSDRCVVVYATSDASSTDRCNAALLANTIAEYHRDQGRQVLLIQDSLTRYVRALRDIALAAGEAPVRRGYPASVFETLPRLLERPGVTSKGSITAFYTILLESDTESDPMAEEIRSILDGHIYLSQKLAERAHFPSVDVLRSLSRLATRICSEQHLVAATAIRGKLSRLEDLQIMLDLGEYRPGDNAENDDLLRKKSDLTAWLKQGNGASYDHGNLLSEMLGHAA